MVDKPTRPQPSAKDWAILKRHGVTPDNLSVGGSLYLDGTAITALPDNLSVGGWLDLSGTAVAALPDGLIVGGWLDLEGTAITALPDGLKVGGALFIEDTPIAALPDNLSVGRSLFLRGTSITALLDDSARGYRLDRAGNHYHAGCRRFTAAEAIAHWGSADYPDQERGARYVAAVKAEEERRANK